MFCCRVCCGAGLSGCYIVDLDLFICGEREYLKGIDINPVVVTF